MSSIDKLAEIFSQFPGIGPRQAKRFVYYLLYRNNGFSKELIDAVRRLESDVSQCQKCFRYFVHTERNKGARVCDICVDKNRDEAKLCIVPRDIDFEAVEKSGSYKGYYFVLGGTLPVLEKEPEKRIRITDLESRVRNESNTLEEIILAMNANTEGENTVEYLKERLKPHNIKISILGRGLSTGAELEYADPDTLSNAFKNRSIG